MDSTATSAGFQAGTNHPTKAKFNVPPERPESPPFPTSTVPFLRDPDFVTREIIFRKIQEKISILGCRIALVGLGGVGKSQLAIEISYLVRSQSPETWVFWVHASNAARFEQSFRVIANQVKISGRHDPEANIYQLVENWLQDEKRGKWVLILDNLDDDELLRKLPTTGQEGLTKGRINYLTKPLLEYLPRSPNGSIVITSRTKEVALKTVHFKDLIPIEPMTHHEALELFLKKLRVSEPEREPEQEMLELVEELNCIPLAIVQAASYIIQHAPRCSISQYLTKIKKSDRDATKLLGYEAGHLYPDWEAKNTILESWQTSFDHIRQKRSSAVDLLSLMSFFDHHAIPTDLLRVQPKSIDHLILELLKDSSSDEESSEGNIDQDFEDDIIALRNYGFISFRGDRNMLTMHRLVQLTTRAWLKSHAQTEHWKEIFIDKLYEEFPTGEYKNWGRCRTLFPHVKSALSQRPKSRESIRKWATLLYRGAWYALETGNIMDGKELAFNSRKERVKIQSEEDDDYEESLASTTMLARAYSLEGRWGEAEQLEVQVLETSKTIFGESHPNTLMSMANLASTYRSQGRWGDAEQLEVQVLETSKTIFGEDHPQILASMANLASTYRNQGRWEEAEQLEVQVLETSKTKLGDDHPDTLTSLSNLASTYRSQGRWNEAEKLEVQVLETSKAKLGEDHPHTLVSMTNIASTYRNQGHWDEAEQLEVQVLETSKTKLGEDHPHTLASMANLASTYRNQGRWEEAEQLEVQVLETSKTKLGEDHPDTLASMANLASTYKDQGRWKKAEQLNFQVTKTRKIRLGEDHPDTLMSISNLASTYRSQGRWNEAEKLEVQVLETSKAKLGEDHPHTLVSMTNIASTYRNQGRWDEAEQLEVQVLEANKAKLGEDHPHTLASMANLASTYRNQGRWKKAEQLQLQVLEKSKKILGQEHPDMLTSMADLASTYKDQGRVQEARRLQLQVIRTRKRVLGPGHPDTLTSMGSLTAAPMDQGPSQEDLSDPESTEANSSYASSLSSRTSFAHPIGIGGVQAFTISLLKNDNFRLICQAAFQQSRIPKARIHKKLAKSLRDFGTRLSQETRKTKHSDVIKFVRGASSNIASRVLQSHSVVSTSVPKELTVHELGKVNSSVRLLEFLKSQKLAGETDSTTAAMTFPEPNSIDDVPDQSRGPIFHAEPEADSKLDSASASDSDKSSSSDYLDLNEQAIVDALQNIEGFLFKSNAFQRMEMQLFDFVYPSFRSILMDWTSNQRRTQRFTQKQIRGLELVISELQHIAPDQVFIKFSNAKAMTNELKGKFENITGQVWDWWPLQPYMRALAKDEARLYWNCVSLVFWAILGLLLKGQIPDLRRSPLG
ncbi:hypothetical protein N7494_008150 [Penicillium frequentans]|uniref:DUF7779 domain-containing protein n=1 Tax=Penicillium frequentans TaxID=3151616 RepID=A0AAD6CWR1_9EURO|nr:hypothetical protein N7494_008150 [Penicillium glabrum]